MFTGKKILFFSANFFGYQNEIKTALEKLGAEVDFYDERPNNTFWTKALIRINKRTVKWIIEKYYNQIIKETKSKKYDFVFFLKAEGINLRMLKQLKDVHSNSKFILYMWDSIKNSSNDIETFFPFFERVLSFDRKDTDKYKFIIFRPLFYLDEYKSIAKAKNSIDYDLTFIGTGHTDRYELVSKVKALCDINGLRSFFFIYLQDVKIFWINKVFKKSYRDAKRNNFSFNSLNKNQIVEIVKKSNCILDIQRAVQSGLTMRTIEILGAKRKLITTNKDVVNYDFYDQKNIAVIDRNTPELNLSFILGEYQELTSEVYEKYSIQNWLTDIFSLEPKES